jgi:O-acetyl-ADP-ribose deacetylase (regulator of RNase III)/uncharacterized protein YwgA
MGDQVEVIKGDIFQSRAQTLVNTVNCVGIMGKGLALEFKKRFPGMYKDYVKRCKRRQVRLGEPYLFRGLEQPFVVNFPTKDHWRSTSRLDDIVRGLDYLESHHKQWGITSIAVPSLGCQQGKLKWRIVLPVLYEHLRHLSIPVELYIPAEASLDEALSVLGIECRGPSELEAIQQMGLQPGLVALVAILSLIEREPYHYPIDRIRFQKLAYFATAQGIPTGLTYGRSGYGPFASELNSRVLSRLVNSNLIRKESSGRMIVIKTGPACRDILPEFCEGLERWKQAIEKVADLMLRTSTTQSEIAATVHFTAKALEEFKERKPTESGVLDAVMKWKQRRKPPIEESEVAVAIRSLAVLGWIDVLSSSDLPLQGDPVHELAAVD